jgi:hypothetical protein
MFSYTQPGSVAIKRLRVTKNFQYPAGSGEYVPGQNLTYSFDTSGYNDGRDSQSTRRNQRRAGQHLYDSLSRLSSATGSGWSQSYQYDGFGNLLARNATGTAPASSFTVDSATNRLGGYTYDSNGNLLATGYQYDPENRLVEANSVGA